ncbi:MAG TPA: SPFH domain-containing protein [Pseudonocardiaceae bacterium]
MPDAVVVTSGLVVLAVLIAVALAVRLVPRMHCAVIERFGRFRRVAGSGLVVLVPFLDRVRATVDLRDQVVTFPARPLGTSDGALAVGMTVRFRVSDPRAAGYAVPNHRDAVVRVATTTLEELVARSSRPAAVDSPEQLRRHLGAELGRSAQRWGIEVDAVELQAVTAVSDTIDATGAVPGEA